MERCRECGKTFDNMIRLQGHRGGAHGRKASRLNLLEVRVDRIEEVLKGARVRVV